MRQLITAAVAIAIGASALAATPALADPYDGHRDHDQREWHHDGRDNDQREWRHDDRGDYGHHEWRRGDRFERGEWQRYHAVDYRYYRLRPPPRGYEWRQVNDRFILAAIASGVIADIVINHR